MPTLRTADTSRESWSQGRTRRNTLATILETLAFNIAYSGGYGQRPIDAQSGGKCTPRRKCCLVCSGCAALMIVAILPVYAFAIVPALHRHILDTSSITLSSSTITMLPCSSLRAAVINEAVIDVVGPFGLTLSPYRTMLSTSATPLSTYISPTTELSTGTNHVKFTTGIDFGNQSSLSEALLGPAITRDHRAVLTIASGDVTTTFLGIKIAGLQVNHQLTCSNATALPPSQFPSKLCGAPRSSLRNGSMIARRLESNTGGYVMHCTHRIKEKIVV